jgi:hypothetical protein
MTIKKTLDTLVKDIYHVMETKEIPDTVDAEAEIEKFGEGIKSLMRQQFIDKDYANANKRKTIRMSNIGRTDKVLWHTVNGTDKEPLTANTYVKFMYGHVIEELMLFLTRLSGHSVTDEQKMCEVAGVRGSMDCKIDGIVIDVKSASPFGFKKFKEGTIAMDDPFGYVDQIKGYAYSEGDTKYGWLVMDKQNGHICTLVYDEEDTEAPVYKYINHSIVDRIEHVKKLVALPEPPKNCADPVPDGKSGNEKLPTLCSYCDFKHSCYPELRVFAYSYGPKFLTKVVNSPRVKEVVDEEGF